MQQENNTKKTPFFHGRRTPAGILLILVIVVAIFIALLMWGSDNDSGRVESYKDASGAAGLNAIIAYDCTAHCEQKFSFNVYLLKDDGQQYGVFRPDKDGRVRLAAPEGEYVMLIAKRFGRDKVFPQEPLALKNGKMLELKLRY